MIFTSFLLFYKQPPHKWLKAKVDKSSSKQKKNCFANIYQCFNHGLNLLSGYKK